jgi:hypothetical protein
MQSRTGLSFDRDTSFRVSADGLSKYPSVSRLQNSVLISLRSKPRDPRLSRHCGASLLAIEFIKSFHYVLSEI